jgi:multiple sugar transport system substrate-binding protein
MKRKTLMAAVAAIVLSAALPAGAQAAVPLTGETVTVLLPPWATLPKDMTDRFTAQTGIKLSLQTLGWDEIRTKIITASIAGSPPADVTEIDWSWVGQFGSSGWYAPLNTSVDAATTKDLPATSIFTYDKKLIGIPYNNDYRLLIFNRQQLSAAGIAQPPKTLAELLADAKTIKEKGVAKFPIALPFSATEGTSTAWYLLTKAFGGDLFDNNLKPLFTSPDSAGYKALAWEIDALKDGLVDPASTGLKDVEVQELFKNGQASFDVAGWAGNLSVYTDPSKSKVASAAEGALMPTVSGKTRTFGLPEAVGIPVASTHKKAAEVFIHWFVAPENQMESYTALGNLPTRTSVLKSLDDSGKLASGKALLAQAAVVEPLFKQGTPGWYPQFSSAVSTAINQAAKGQLTVDAAIKQIAAQTAAAEQQ